MSDFPKLSCPFIRQTFPVEREGWRKYGSRLGLREPQAHLVIDLVNPGFEWVFEDEDTFAVEKLNGSNVKILTRVGRVKILDWLEAARAAVSVRPQNAVDTH